MAAERAPPCQLYNRRPNNDTRRSHKKGTARGPSSARSGGSHVGGARSGATGRVEAPDGGRDDDNDDGDDGSESGSESDSSASNASPDDADNATASAAGSGADQGDALRRNRKQRRRGAEAVVHLGFKVCDAGLGALACFRRGLTNPPRTPPPPRRGTMRWATRSATRARRSPSLACDGRALTVPRAATSTCVTAATGHPSARPSTTRRCTSLSRSRNPSSTMVTTSTPPRWASTATWIRCVASCARRWEKVARPPCLRAAHGRGHTRRDGRHTCVATHTCTFASDRTTIRCNKQIGGILSLNVHTNPRTT